MINLVAVDWVDQLPALSPYIYVRENLLKKNVYLTCLNLGPPKCKLYTLIRTGIILAEKGVTYQLNNVLLDISCPEIRH